uniref:Transmembrane protein n=1 Tax=Medicago truncatula TaxID=3880 RepID=Q2HU83_MEDTR|nr:hypothetical protein MtrDRAFT_AC149208g35v2 [Medicago truncatula]
MSMWLLQMLKMWLLQMLNTVQMQENGRQRNLSLADATSWRLCS